MAPPSESIYQFAAQHLFMQYAEVRFLTQQYHALDRCEVEASNELQTEFHRLLRSCPRFRAGAVATMDADVHVGASLHATVRQCHSDIPFNVAQALVAGLGMEAVLQVAIETLSSDRGHLVLSDSVTAEPLSSGKCVVDGFGP